MIALRLENPFEKAVPLSVDNPLQAAMGIGLEQTEPFLYQCIQQEEQQFVCINRKDHLKLLWAQIEHYRDRWVYLNLSQKVKHLLWEEEEEEVIAAQWEMPRQALYAFAAGVNFYRTEGQDLRGMETELASVSQLIQRGQWMRKMAYTGLALALLLSLLVLSNLILGWQNTQYQTLAQDKSALFSQLPQLEEQVANRKKQLLRLQRQLQVSRFSFWLDRSLQDFPEDVVLRSWQSPPDPRKLASLDLAEQEFHLLLEGSTPSPRSINWVRQNLLKLPGVAQIHLAPAPYQFQEDRYPFVILIRFHPDYFAP
jgi:hypothetical protein